MVPKTCLKPLACVPQIPKAVTILSVSNFKILAAPAVAPKIPAVAVVCQPLW